MPDWRRLPLIEALIEGPLIEALIEALSVFAVILIVAAVAEWMGSLRLAILAWIGFPFMILTGAVLWDNRPWKFAAIRSGDWLMKLVLMTTILGIWH